MAKFERSRERKSKGRRDSRDRRGSRNTRDRRDSGRGSNRFSRDRRDSGRGPSRFSRKRDVEMTKVICSACGDECEVPFKPTSSKPVYCSDCFEKKEKGSSNRGSSNKFSERDLDIINEKLNKIMKALKIEE